MLRPRLSNCTEIVRTITELREVWWFDSTDGRNLGLLWRLTGDYGIGRHVERDLFKRRKSINGETVILMAA